MRIVLYIVIAIVAWFLYMAFTRPSIPVAPGSSAAGLSPAELEYYRQVFDYTMTNIEAGKPYEWGSYGGKGAISPGVLFISKSQSACREFSENIQIGGRLETRDGIACRREGGNGWCRLRKDQALTCAMETPAAQSGMVGGVNVGMPAINLPGGNGGGAAGGMYNPGAPPPLDPPRYSGEQPKGGDIADAVTGTAGEAAGKATGGAIKWFQDTFR